MFFASDSKFFPHDKESKNTMCLIINIQITSQNVLLIWSVAFQSLLFRLKEEN